MLELPRVVAPVYFTIALVVPAVLSPTFTFPIPDAGVTVIEPSEFLTEETALSPAGSPCGGKVCG